MKGYMTEVLVQEMYINSYPKPCPVSVGTFADGCIAMRPIFKTKKAARAFAGKDCRLAMVEMSKV